MSSQFTTWRGFMRIIVSNYLIMSPIWAPKTAPLQNAARTVECGMRRFKIDPNQVAGDTVVIAGPDVNHMVNVLRLKAGAAVLLLDGTGTEYLARIEKFSRGEVHLSVQESRPGRVESPTRVTVAQGFLKDRKMDTLIRPLTELGISRWIPFFAERSVARPNAEKLAKRAVRWQKIADEALKQCRRTHSPRIEIASDFDAMLQLSGEAAVKLVFWEEASAAFSEAVSADGPPGKGEVFIILGPEGGLTAAEVDRSGQAGFLTLSLGPRILRAETATLAAGTMVQYLFGDLGSGRRERQE